MAIEKSLKDLAPDCEILAINGFGYTYPLLEQVINKAYMGIIKNTPQVWEYLYDNQKIAKRFESLKTFLHKSSHKKLAELFNDFKPDVVVCTQAFPCGMAADYKRSENLPIKVIGVLTDHAPHLYWVHEGVDYLVVPSEMAKQRYLKEGYKQDQVKVLGIPIRPKFAEYLNREAICQKLKLDPHMPIVLIMGGGQGLGPMKETAKALLALKKTLQLIVISGTNVKLYEWLRKQQKKDKKILVYDYAANVDELMTVASLIVSKPGGMTTSECLTKGLPMVIVDPIPGQEQRNAQFLVHAGIAVKVNEKQDIASTIEHLLQDKARLQSMRTAALKHAKPHAAADIARLALTV